MTYFHLGMGGPDGAHPNLGLGYLPPGHAPCRPAGYNPYRPTCFGYVPYVDALGRVYAPSPDRRRQPEDDMLNAKKVKIDCDELTATVEQMRRLGAAYLEHAYKTLRNFDGEFRDQICEDLWDDAMLPLRSFNDFAAKYAPSVKPIEGLERDAGPAAGAACAANTIGGQGLAANACANHAR